MKVKQTKKDEQVAVAPKPKEAGDSNTAFNMLFIVVNSLVVLFVSALVYQHFKGDFCDSGIPEAEGAANCSILRLSDGKQCRACPTNAVCKKSKILNCNEGFRLLNKEICYPNEGSHMQENLLNYLNEMDGSFQRGNTFKNWGSAERNFITATEMTAHFTPKSETTAANENEVTQAVENVLNTISQTGQDDFCLRNRF